MLKSFNLSTRSVFYYDTERKTLARFPSKSNLLPHGSDNSLYFGMKSNDEVSKMFCEFFNVKKIDNINGLNFDMSCGGEIVNVVINLNAEGQIQVKICKDGTMGRLTSNYSFDEMQEFDFTKMLIVVDFMHKEIRFKNPNELRL